MNRLLWMAVAVIGAMIGGGAVWRQQTAAGAGLRAEIAALRTQTTVVAPMQPAATEMERLRDDHGAVARLRQEIDALKRQVNERARVRLVRGESQPAATAREWSLSAEMVPIEHWQNRGRSTPTEAMETVLWAAAGGEIGVLAEALELEPAARTKATALLAEMPDAIRTEYGTPERLVALLATHDVPLGSAMILTPKLMPDGAVIRIAQVSDGSGKIKRATIALKLNDDAWRLVVPETAVDRYAAMLKHPRATSKVAAPQ